jgi:hypothetical protein
MRQGREHYFKEIVVMKYGRRLYYSILTLVFFTAQPFAQSPSTSFPEDSLTCALCQNNEQIVSKRNGEYRIEYYMGETQLNMKTMSGFLSLNSASNHQYRKFKAHRGGGIALVIAGIGCIVADGYITKPSFPFITFGGIAMSISGIVVYIGANEKFRSAIHAYNKDICKIK